MMRRRNRWGTPGPRFVAAHTEVRVRFQEVDSLRVVWHGHYLSFCEEGRTAFGREFGLSYQSILDAGYVAPLVHFELDFFQPARFDQIVHVETRLHLDPGARINFTYVLSDGRPDREADEGTRGNEESDRRKLFVGHSVQVFTEVDGSLVLTQPEFYSDFLARVEPQAQRAPNALGS